MKNDKKPGSEQKKGAPGRAVDPAPRKPEGRVYVCISGHEDPQGSGFIKYKAGAIETFIKTPPAAYWRLQDEIKERKEQDNGTGN